MAKSCVFHNRINQFKLSQKNQIKLKSPEFLQMSFLSRKLSKYLAHLSAVGLVAVTDRDHRGGVSAQTVTEILDMAETVILLGDQQNGDTSFNIASMVKDKDLWSGIAIPSADKSKQWIKFDWSSLGQDLLVEGVFLYTVPSQMASGWIRFFVDSVECPDTNWVGVDAIGGVFNCGLAGKTFTIICETACEPNLSVTEVKLWTSAILSTKGTTYNFAQNVAVNGRPNNKSKVFFNGSLEGRYDGDYNEANYWIHEGGNSKPGVCIELETSSEIYQIVAMTDGNHGSMGFSVREDRIDVNPSTGSTYGNIVSFSTSNMPEYLTINGSWTARNVCAWRNFYQLHIQKIIVIGKSSCDQVIPDGPLTGANFSWTTFEPQKVGDFIELDGPTWAICQSEITLSDISLEFTDVSPLLTQGSLNWVTFNPVTNKIRVQPQIDAFLLYPQMSLVVKINASLISNPLKTNSYFGFSVNFQSPEVLWCSQSEITAPLSFPKDLAVEKYQEEPLIFELEKVQDSGTIELSKITGFENDTCGPFKITLKSGLSLVTQDSPNDRQFSIQTQDTSSVGKHEVILDIVSEKWSNLWTSIQGEITVLPCKVEELVDPDEVILSPIQQVFEIPYSTSIVLPKFEPGPQCGLSNADIEYKLDESTPEWVTLDTKNHKVTIDVDDQGLQGKSVPVLVTASYKDVTEEMKFSIKFKKQAKEDKAESTQQTEEPKPEPEEEKQVQEDTEDDEETAAVSGWDGWLSLLNIDELLPEGVSLPPPNPDPTYVPTPPIPSFGKISARGATQIQFSENVFKYENLKDLMVPKPPEQRRMLQTSITVADVEHVKFIDVFVEPGENSDPEKLGFDYSLDFVNDKTIDITIKWENPPFVSANQPEDVLVIKFNGPFFDQEDGIDIEQKNRELRQVIPPQLVPGAITDAIQGAGGSLQITSATTVVGNAAINILLAGSLNQVWGMVNNLQIVVHTPLINVQFPANAFLLYDVMITVATFDILPTDEIFPTFFPQLPEDNPFNDKFDRLGVGSSFLVMNMGTMLIIFTFYAILYALYPCFKFIKDEAKCAKKLEKSTRSMLFWNHTIIFLYEGYLDILLSGAVNLYFLREGTFTWDSWSLFITNVLSFFLVACCAFLLFFVLFYIWPRFDKLKSKKIKRKFQPAYEMLNLRHGQLTILWPVFFMMRRVLFVVGVCALVKHTEFQLILFMLPTLACMVVLASIRPLENLPANKLETYNSFMILMMTYCLMCFTPFALDPEARYTMGFVMVILTTKNISVNIYLVSQDPVRKSFLRCRLRYRRRHQIKQEWKQKLQKIRDCWRRVKACCTGKKEKEIDEQIELKISIKQLETISEEDSFDAQPSDRREQRGTSTKRDERLIDPRLQQNASKFKRKQNLLQKNHKDQVQNVHSRFTQSQLEQEIAVINSRLTRYTVDINDRTYFQSLDSSAQGHQQSRHNQTLSNLRSKADQLSSNSSSSCSLYCPPSVLTKRSHKQAQILLNLKNLRSSYDEDLSDSDSEKLQIIEEIRPCQKREQSPPENLNDPSRNIKLSKFSNKTPENCQAFTPRYQGYAAQSNQSETVEPIVLGLSKFKAGKQQQLLTKTQTKKQDDYSKSFSEHKSNSLLLNPNVMPVLSKRQMLEHNQSNSPKTHQTADHTPQSQLEDQKTQLRKKLLQKFSIGMEIKQNIAAEQNQDE